ncbi:tetratricopeptide repeat protein [Roseateles koreensis]|uniref:Tetratricopeptide repeat-containing protein n=1 Tax=Roseateles koreensis TaxID=2987526 RepID=A0ABT5KQ65_9BURK|nr:hypothetical protein [Roseateles koreensis]MDC8785054.1 hypothetical protein [Roseateles koreensis]
MNFLAAADPGADLLQRLARIAERHPQSALYRLEALEQRYRAAHELGAALDALYARFYLLEHRGRALELQRQLVHARRDAAGLPLQEARISEALGRLAYQQGEYAEAAAQWNHAIHLSRQTGDVWLGVAARIGLGQIHYAMAAWDEGRHVHREAAELLGPQQDTYLRSKLALNIGVGYFECARLDDAERHFSHGLAAARNGHHREYEAEAHWHLARAALARGRLDWATTDCRNALNIAGKLGHSWLESVASQTWTDIALARGDFTGAVRSAEHGLNLARRIHSRPQESQAHLRLARLLEQQGDLAGALNHLWQHLALRNELERLTVQGLSAQSPSQRA